MILKIGIIICAGFLPGEQRATIRELLNAARRAVPDPIATETSRLPITAKDLAIDRQTLEGLRAK